jgi:hypothetical protein
MKCVAGVGQPLFTPSPCEGLPVLLCCDEIVPDRRECLSYQATLPTASRQMQEFNPASSEWDFGFHEHGCMSRIPGDP